MTDVQSSAAIAPDSKALGFVAAALLIFIPPIGVILAYIDRPKASPLLASHYSYMIGTFWKGLLFYMVSLILTFVVVGIFAMFAVWIWYIVRCIKSLVYLSRDEAIAQPSTWWV